MEFQVLLCNGEDVENEKLSSGIVHPALAEENMRPTAQLKQPRAAETWHLQTHNISAISNNDRYTQCLTSGVPSSTMLAIQTGTLIQRTTQAQLIVYIISDSRKS